LVPQHIDRVCTADLGSRLMLVYSHGNDLTGVVVDDFGCGDVRLTDEPFRTVPGEATQAGTVRGVLTDRGDLLNDIKGMEPATSPPDLVLGPRGVGPLRLGMRADQVAATDAATAPLGASHDGWRPGCRVLQYRPARLGRIPDDTVDGIVSARQGLEALYATERMITPEGIRLGSTIDEVRRAYGRPHTIAGDQVVVHASPGAVYRIQLEQVVTSISLQLRRLDCER
jgi:hypothetical protein